MYVPQDMAGPNNIRERVFGAGRIVYTANSQIDEKPGFEYIMKVILGCLHRGLDLRSGNKGMRTLQPQEAML